jgi:hypothetical protein
MKEVIIHAGYPKSGSTSLQHTMFHNRERLAAKGILYPSSWRSNHGVPLTILFYDDVLRMFDERDLQCSAGQISEMGQNLTESLKEELRATSCETLIISGENICSFNASVISRVLEFFSSLLNTPKIRIILYVRNPVDYYTSALNTMVTWYGRTLDSCKDKFEGIHPWEADLVDARPYSNRLPEFFEAAGGRKIVEIYSFESAIRDHGGPVEHFFNLLGLTPEETKEFLFIKANESKSQMAVEFYDYFNRVEPLYLVKSPVLKINPQRLPDTFNSGCSWGGGVYLPCPKAPELDWPANSPRMHGGLKIPSALITCLR